MPMAASTITAEDLREVERFVGQRIGGHGLGAVSESGKVRTYSIFQTRLRSSLTFDHGSWSLGSGPGHSPRNQKPRTRTQEPAFTRCRAPTHQATPGARRRTGTGACPPRYARSGQRTVPDASARPVGSLSRSSSNATHSSARGGCTPSAGRSISGANSRPTKAQTRRNSGSGVRQRSS